MAEKEEKKKVKTPTAQKRDIQNLKKQMINKQLKSRVSTAIRSYSDSLAKKEDKEETSKKLSSAHSVIDKAIKKGIFHKSKGSRMKGNLSKKLT